MFRYLYILLVMLLQYFCFLTFGFANPFQKTKNAVYSGAVVNSSDMFFYSAAVRSLWNGIHDTGWQVRLMVGKGNFSYTKDQIDYVGDKTNVEAMLGYQYVKKPFFLKLYVGPHYVIQTVNPLDAGLDGLGQEFGAKLQFESWVDLNQSDRFLSLDASFSTLENNYLVNLKVGTKGLLDLQIGLEAEMSGDSVMERQAAGLFANYRWTPTSVIGLTIGVSQNAMEEKGLYSKLKYDIKF